MRNVDIVDTKYKCEFVNRECPTATINIENNFNTDNHHYHNIPSGQNISKA